MKHKIIKIISGGQTGADRAAFDFALENGIEMAGFVPKGRRAEDGRIPDKYPNLVETERTNYAERTELNVINSDITIIFSHGKPTGGTLLTQEIALKYKKDFIFIDLAKKRCLDQILAGTKENLITSNLKTLNIAGPRASEDPEIYQKTKDFLTLLFD